MENKTKDNQVITKSFGTGGYIRINGTVSGIIEIGNGDKIGRWNGEPVTWLCGNVWEFIL